MVYKIISEFARKYHASISRLYQFKFEIKIEEVQHINSLNITCRYARARVFQRLSLICTSIAPTPPWAMGYAQETQHSQLTQRIQVFIKSLKFVDEVLLESQYPYLFLPRSHLEASKSQILSCFVKLLMRG